MANITSESNKRYDAETAPTYLSRRRFGAAATLAAAGAAFSVALAPTEAGAA